MICVECCGLYNSVIVDLLCNQNNLLRSPSHELRTVCFLPLKLALESKRSKLVSLAVTGLNVSEIIIRDYEVVIKSTCATFDPYCLVR